MFPLSFSFLSQIIYSKTSSISQNNQSLLPSILLIDSKNATGLIPNLIPKFILYLFTICASSPSSTSALAPRPMLQVHALPLQDCLHALTPRFNAHFRKLILHDKVILYVFWPPHTTYLVHSWYFTLLRSTHFVLRPFLVVSCPIYRHSLRFPCIHGPMRVKHIILEWIRATNSVLSSLTHLSWHTYILPQLF